MKWGSAAPLVQARASDFEFAISRFEPCRPSQAVRRPETLPLVTSEMPANGGLFRIGYRSPGSEIGCCGSEITDSLRRIFEIFPFSGDSDGRPGSIGTAWRRRKGPNCQPPTPSSNRSLTTESGTEFFDAEGFKIIQSGDVSNFYCSSCDNPVEP